MKKIQTFLFLGVLIFTFILRAHNYEKTPGPGHLDEMLYAWSGMYLIETGTPISWSTLGYPKSAEFFKGKISYKGGEPSTYATLYKPWLDEPPLFSLISGGSAHLFHADKNDFVSSAFTRFPVVIISTITSIFLFLVAKKLLGYGTGILSMLVYGTTPIIVFGSRTAMPENLIALLFLISIYLLILFKNKKKEILLLPIPFLAGLAGLSKPTGFFILPFAIFYYIYIEKNKLKNHKRIIFRNIAIMSLITLFFVGIYFLYGYYYDWNIFKSIFLTQSTRPAGFNSLAWFLITPSFGTTVVRDALYVFCVLASFYYLIRTKATSKFGIISFAFIYWLGVVMTTGGENDLLSWYRFPLFPLISIFGALGIQKLYRKNDLFSLFLFIPLVLGNRMLLVNAFKPNLDPIVFRNVFVLLLLPAVSYLIFKKKIWLKLSKLVFLGVLLVGIYMNIVYVYSAHEIVCESVSCPLVDSTWLSRLHFPLIWRFFVVN